MEVIEERLRGARGSPELEGQPDGRNEGRGGGKGQEASKRTGAITGQSTASLDGSLARYGWKDEMITGRAGYGSVFTLTRKEHPDVVTAAQRRAEGRRKQRAAGGRLAGYGTLYGKR